MAKQKNMGKLFTDSEISAFCSQLALILKSGLSPYEGVTAMLEDALLEEEKKILTCLSEKLAMGEDLSHSLEEQQLFPSYMIEMVKILDKMPPINVESDYLHNGNVVPRVTKILSKCI